ncbi:hypothetical protein BgiBS90_028518, partial [Biomphalaria glabrata]
MVSRCALRQTVSFCVTFDRQSILSGIVKAVQMTQMGWNSLIVVSMAIHMKQQVV